MASFREEADAAAESLARLNREADRSAKGEQKREQEADQRFSRAALSSLGAGAGGAASAFGVTGSSSAASDVAFGTAVGALSRANIGGIPVGDLLSRVSGLKRSIDAAEGAGARTFEQFEELARYNVPVSDEVLQRNIDINLAQQQRIEGLRQKVNARVGGLDAITEASGDGAGDGATLRDILEILRAIRDALPFSRSGDQR